MVQITTIEELKKVNVEYRLSSLGLQKSSKDIIQIKVFQKIISINLKSFEIFEKVQIETPIIFCTAYDKYAIQAFKVNSIDYLLKPVEKEDLEKALGKLQKLKSSSTSLNPDDVKKIIETISGSKSEYKSRFLVRIGNKLRSITTDEIAYFVTEYKIVNIVTTENKKYPVENSLEELETMLSPDEFFRTNRQTIISVKSVKSAEKEFGRYYVYLKTTGKKEFTVSRERVKSFKEWLDK